MKLPTRHFVTPSYLLACLLLGGASAAGYAANLLLQLAAIPLIAWAVWTLVRDGVPNAIIKPLGLLVLLLAVFLIQFVPLPPELWTKLPGRSFIAEGYRLLDSPLPPLPLTLTPDNAVGSMLWLLPAIAVFLCVVVLGAFQGTSTAIVIVGVTIVSVGLGTVQLVSNKAYLYEFTNYGAAVGFFANSNHNATLLLASIPFLAALQKALLQRNRSTRKASAIRVMVWGFYAVIFVGLLTNASVAGIGLTLPVALSSWIVFGDQRPAVRKATLFLTLLGTASTLMLVVFGGLGNNLFGAQTENANVSRQTSFARTFDLSIEYFPFGSGVGSFQSVYKTMEPINTVSRTYMNHAHNDWLEVFLETGVFGVGLAVLFLFWWIGRLRAIWGAEDRRPYAQAAAIATAAIMLHSLVDYPLRTAAISALFTLSLGLMTGIRPSAKNSKRSKQKSGGRHIDI